MSDHVVESVEGVGRAAQVQRALGLEGRHQDAFFRIEDFGRFTHKSNPGNDYGTGRVVMPKAGHFQGIGYTAAGFIGQHLQVIIDIVVGDQNRVPLLQELFNARD